MINWKSILSSFNDKPTLLEWLKLVEKALKESVLTSVAAEQDADKTNTRLLFNFEDGTQIVSEFFKTKGDKGRSIASVSSTGQTQSDGFTRSGFKVNYDDKNYDVIYLYAKNGKAISSLSSSVKEVTDDSTINTITVNYDDKTSNTFDVSSARGKQGLKGNDGVSITGIDTVSDEVVGDETLTTLRAHYSNNTSDEFVVTAKNGKDGSGGKLYLKRLEADGVNSVYNVFVSFYSSNAEKKFDLNGAGFGYVYEGVSERYLPIANCTMTSQTNAVIEFINSAGKLSFIKDYDFSYFLSLLKIYEV